MFSQNMTNHIPILLTDHRVGLTLYALDDVMNNGNLKLVIDPLIAHAQAEAIQEAGL